mgnify:CR=1 FL=1
MATSFLKEEVKRRIGQLKKGVRAGKSYVKKLIMPKNLEEYKSRIQAETLKRIGPEEARIRQRNLQKIKEAEKRFREKFK